MLTTTDGCAFVPALLLRMVSRLVPAAYQSVVLLQADLEEWMGLRATSDMQGLLHETSAWFIHLYVFVSGCLCVCVSEIEH